MAEVHLYCPACNRKLRIPEEMLGQWVQCPLCQTTFSAPSRPMLPPQPGAETPPAGPPLPVPPGPVAPPPGPMPFPPREYPATQGPAARSPWLMFVGLGLVALGLIDLALNVVRIVIFTTVPLEQLVADSPMRGMLEGNLDQSLLPIIFAFVLVLMFASLILIVAGVQMLRLRTYWLAVVGCIVALFYPDCVCCLLSVPLGIGGLILLFQPEVRESFQ